MAALDLTGAVWRKSTRSSGSGNCVEIAELGDLVAIRDSKDPNGGALVFTLDAWQTFVHAVKVGELGE
jgi:Domain of unknown function (DUF397).